ncbi:MAG: epimerase [Sideroxyarcus sp.]|nr:epimerase [Sideroxyarcus sp.]
MRIFITGGTGLIGRALCRALRAEGHTLTVLSRRPETVAAKCGADVRAFASLDDWRPDQPFDAVINLAGEPIIDAWWSARRKQLLWDSRVTLTEELVRRIHAAEHKPAVLLSGSAVGYYGDRGDTVLDENAEAGTGFSAELCKAWEQAALAAEKQNVRPRHGAAEPTGAGVAASHLLPQTADYVGNESKVRVCLLRTAPVLSRDGGLLGKMLLPFKLGLGARLGDGRQWMSWIHIDDYVALVLRLLRDEQMRGAFNMAAPQPVTNGEFTRTLAHVLHRPAFFVAPGFMLKLAMGERSALLLEGQRVLPVRLEAAGASFALANLESALRALLP